MIRLQLESATDKLPLDSLLTESEGVHATTGATGFGLPPVALQWLEGAGDGAVYRGRRVLPRDIDLPLYFSALGRDSLKELQRRLNLILSGPATLRAFEPDGTSWYLTVVRSGGGGYIYGTDTDGEHELATVLTLTAGDPYWTSTEGAQHVIRRTGATRGLLPALGRMRVSAASAFGTITMENPGDAQAYPVWRVAGPGRNFKAVSPTGETLHWTGTLAKGETLTIDTKTGRVTDQSGANRYADLAAAPRMWAIPPGTSLATAMVDEADANTSVTCTWQPRAWAVI